MNGTGKSVLGLVLYGKTFLILIPIRPDYCPVLNKPDCDWELNLPINFSISPGSSPLFEKSQFRGIDSI
jgi:hypothetical protein